MYVITPKQLGASRSGHAAVRPGRGVGVEVWSAASPRPGDRLRDLALSSWRRVPDAIQRACVGTAGPVMPGLYVHGTVGACGFAARRPLVGVLEKMRQSASHPAAGKAGIALLFAFEHHGSGLPEPVR
jgi:hypothetical protein